MFQFTGLPSQDLFVQSWIDGHYPARVSPFGYLWINTSVQLPRAFRRFRVLLRQLVPRHSSYTLFSLTRIYLIECSIYASNSTTMQLSKNSFAGLFRFDCCFCLSPRHRPQYSTAPYSPCQGSDKVFCLSCRRSRFLVASEPPRGLPAKR